MKRNNKDCTILVVDDEEGIRTLIADILEMEGFSYFTAEDGKEAFERICSTKIDAVISDIRMPNVDGIDLLDKVRARDLEFPRLALLTGYSDYSIIDIYDKGAEAFLAKPFRLNVLLALVNKLLSPYGDGWVAPDPKTISLQIDRKFESIKSASDAGALRFGRGGFFIEWKEGTFPVIGTKTKINLEFGKNKADAIVGFGTVRWIRKKADNIVSPGIGIEFDFLNPESQDHFLEFIHSAKLKPFIPRG